jgi:uncharacterized membrane protein HdeD (DUF308 family)
MKNLLNPWWSNLIQGIIFILLSFIIFSNPIAFLETIALWLGILVILAGLSGIAFYWASKPEHKSTWSLVASIVIALLGLTMISRMLITVNAITIVFGVLVLITGINILYGSFQSRLSFKFWWLPAIFGVLAIITGAQSIMRMNEGAQAITFLVSVSLLISGVGMIILALVKKRIQT